MCKYEMDPTSIVEDTEWTHILSTDGRTDGRTDGQTDGRRETSIPPFQLHWSGGYDYLFYVSDHMSKVLANQKMLHMLHISLAKKDLLMWFETVHRENIILLITWDPHIGLVSSLGTFSTRAGLNISSCYLSVTYTLKCITDGTRNYWRE